MRILGIETATIVCGAAIVQDGIVLSNHEIAEKNVHAESLMLLVDRATKEANTNIQALDAIAVSIGPGSFTGLRIGLSVAKGLAFSTGKPIIAVPTLKALAYRLIVENKISALHVLSAIDARRDEVYCQLFRVIGIDLVAEWEERDMSVANVLSEIDGKSCLITGDGVPKIQRQTSQPAFQFLTGLSAQCSASIIALLGEKMGADNLFVDAATIEPKYVKEFYTKLVH